MSDKKTKTDTKKSKPSKEPDSKDLTSERLFKRPEGDELIHPIEKYRDEVSAVLNDIAGQGYAFDSELNEMYNSMQVQLSEVPDQAIDLLNEQYALAQGYRSRVAEILMNVISEKSFWESCLSKLKTLYEKGESYYMTSPDYEYIMLAKNQAIREAYIKDYLAIVLDAMKRVERVVYNLSDILSVANIKKDDFDSILMNISRQQRNIETMVGLGAEILYRKRK